MSCIVDRYTDRTNRPKSPSGKIQRKILKEWANKDAQKFGSRREGVKL